MAEFPGNCSPRIVSVGASTGCSLTRADINGMTPQMFADQDADEVKMDDIIANAQEARMAGYIETPMDMLLMGAVAPIKGALNQISIPGQGSVILPYFYRQQKHNINANSWKVSAGAAAPGAGTGGAHPGLWNLTVQNNPSVYASALKDLERYFQPGKYVLVEALDGSGNSISMQYKVIATANATTGGTEQATITVEPSVTNSGWSALSASEKADYQLTAGNLLILANSVSDYESWAYNDAHDNPNDLLTYWLQTSRETHEYNDEYLEALDAALTSNFWKKFKQLPLAEQKRQQHARYMKSWQHSLFYGQKINENQSEETYKQLPTVVDPVNPSCTLEYKANAKGIKTLLQDCGRWLDHQGNPLSVESLISTLQNVKRARQADGGTIDRIDIMTDRETAGKIYQMMSSFYAAKYGVTTVRNYAEKGQLAYDSQIVFNYHVYQLPPDLGTYELCVFHHEFFDDRLLAFDSSIRNRGRTVWAIDWSDVQVGIAQTNSATRMTNEADDIYNTIIKANIHHYQLNSTKWSVVVEDPNRHYGIDNFNDDCPVLTVAGCTI